MIVPPSCTRYAQQLVRCKFHRELAMAQDTLTVSLQVLPEVCNISIPPPHSRTPGWVQPPPSLERSLVMRFLIITNVRHGACAPALPALPVSGQKLSRDAGCGISRCGTWW